MSSNLLPFFVYGTLRPQEENYYLLDGHTLQEDAAHIKGFQLYSLGSYPMVIRTQDPAHIVYGVVVTVKPDLYAEVQSHLDWLEEYDPQNPNGPYQRIVETIHLDSGENVNAWLYDGNPTYLNLVSHHLIPNGDWVTFRQGYGAR